MVELGHPYLHPLADVIQLKMAEVDHRLHAISEILNLYQLIYMK